MRWYKIVTSSETWDATGDPYALNVEFDIPVAPKANPTPSGAFVRIWGIPLQTLLNARQFNMQPIQVYGGMQQGLPLADPSQQGLLVQGMVFPALGNWVGTDMTLDFNIATGTGSPNFGQPANIVHNWLANTPMSQTLQQTLTTAFPKYTPQIKISQNLKLPYNDYGFYESIEQFANYIYSISKTIMNQASYRGVHMTTKGTTIVVEDGTQQAQGPQIKFTDLIGQPIWTGLKTVQFKTVTRGDINIGDTVTLPQSLATLTTAGAGVGGNNNNSIQGSFLIQQIRHTGNFRQPDGFGWVSTFDGIMQ
jgi:hypothetical protein